MWLGDEARGEVFEILRNHILNLLKLTSRGQTKSDDPKHKRSHEA